MAAFQNEERVQTQIHTQNVAGSSVTVNVYGSKPDQGNAVRQIAVHDGSEPSPSNLSSRHADVSNIQGNQLPSDEQNIKGTEHEPERVRLEPVSKVICLIPYNRNASFINRSVEMQRLHTLLDPKYIDEAAASRPFAILHGLGGIGKTSLATEFAYRYHCGNPLTAIFWVHANTDESIHQSLARIAIELEISVGEEDQLDLVSRLAAWLTHKANPSWFMVIDNADDPDVLFRSHKQLIDALMRCSRGSLLFTTRTKKVAMRVATRLGRSDATISVRPMDEDEALLLIRSCSASQFDAATPEPGFDPTAAKVVAELVGHLPLALVQASTYVRENFISLSRYVQMWHESLKNAQDLLEFEFDDEGRSSTDAEIPNAVAAALVLSLDLLAHKHEFASELLCLTTFFHHNGIPESLILDDEMRANDVSFVSALGELTALSLVSRNPSTHTLEVHRLVHIVAHMWQVRRDASRVFNARAIKVLGRLNKLFPRHPSKQDRPRLDMYISHAISYLSLNPQVGEAHRDDKILLERKTAEHLLYQGRTYQAATLRMQILAEIQKSNEPETTNILRAKHELALVLKRLRQFKDAEDLCREVIRSCGKSGQPGYGSITHINTVSLLCHLLAETKSYEEAYIMMDVARQAIAVRYSDDDEINVRLEYQAAQLKRQEALDLPPKDAERKIELLIESKTLLLMAGARVESTSGSRSNLGVIGTQHLAGVLSDLDEIDKAEAMHQLVCTVKSELLGKTHVETFQARRNLISFYLNRNQTAKASSVLDELLAQQELALSELHPERLKARRCLARVYEQQTDTLMPQIEIQREHVRVAVSRLDQGYSDAEDYSIQITTQQSELNVQEAELRAEVNVMWHIQQIYATIQSEERRIGTSTQSDGRRDNRLQELAPRRNEARAKRRAQSSVIQAQRDTVVKEEQKLRRLQDNVLKQDGELESMRCEIRSLRDSLQKLLEPATALMQKAIAEQEQVMLAMTEALGLEQPETLDSMSECAKTIQKGLLLDRAAFQDFVVLAKSLLQDVLKYQTKLHDDQNHEDILSAKALLAAHLHDQKSYTDAEKLEREVLVAEKLKHGLYHVRTLMAMHALAETYAAQGTAESRLDAIDLLEECCKASVMVLGEGHPDTQPRFELLDKCRTESQMYDDASSASRSSRIIRDMDEVLAVRSSVHHDTPRFSLSVASRGPSSRNMFTSRFAGSNIFQPRNVVPSALNVVRGFTVGQFIGGRSGTAGSSK